MHLMLSAKNTEISFQSINKLGKNSKEIGQRIDSITMIAGHKKSLSRME